jgi:hypothetical protein
MKTKPFKNLLANLQLDTNREDLEQVGMSAKYGKYYINIYANEYTDHECVLNEVCYGSEALELTPEQFEECKVKMQIEIGHLLKLKAMHNYVR